MLTELNASKNVRLMNLIGRLSLVDDVASLHVKIDNLNISLVGFCFIRSIDFYGAAPKTVSGQQHP
jgi:hypothetical protein